MHPHACLGRPLLRPTDSLCEKGRHVTQNCASREFVATGKETDPLPRTTASGSDFRVAPSGARRTLRMRSFRPFKFQRLATAEPNASSRYVIDRQSLNRRSHQPGQPLPGKFAPRRIPLILISASTSVVHRPASHATLPNRHAGRQIVCQRNRVFVSRTQSCAHACCHGASIYRARYGTA